MLAAPERIRVAHVDCEDVHRVVSQTDQHRDKRAPTEVPECASEQIRIDLFLRVGVDTFLERHVHQIEEVKETDPGNARYEVGPAQNHSTDCSAVGRMKNFLEHSQTDGEMSS